MKRHDLLLVPLVGMSLFFSMTLREDAQTQQPTSSGTTAKTPAQSVGLFVYPQKKQTATAQAKDEGECYSSAKQESGVDPANPQPAVTTPQTAQAPVGGGVKGAAGGAGAGAAIGAIAGDAGEGAAIGATAGAIHGRRAQRKAKKQAAQQAQHQAAAAKQQSVDTFKRAMTACLESRNYSVK
jgi:hypothetical protein